MADASDLLIAALLKDQDSYKEDPLYRTGTQLIASPPISREYKMSPWERLAAGLLTGFGGSVMQSIAKGGDNKQAKTLKLVEALSSSGEQQKQMLEQPGMEIAKAIVGYEDKAKKEGLSDYMAKKKLDAVADIQYGDGVRVERMTPQGVTVQERKIYDPTTDTFSMEQYGQSQSPYDKKLQEARAEAAAGNSLYGGGFDPKKTADIEDSMRNELKKGEPVSQFLKAETPYQNMLKAFHDPSGTADVSILYGAVMNREPGLAVRQDDQTLIMGANGLGGVFAQAAGYLTSGQRFTPQMRADLIREASNSRNTRLSLLRQDYDTASSIAERRKLTKDNILPFPIPEDSSSLMEKTIGGELWQDKSGKNWIITKDAKGNAISRSPVE